MIIWKSFYAGYSGITNSAHQMVRILEEAGVEHRIQPFNNRFPADHPFADKLATQSDLDEGTIILHQIPVIDPMADGYYTVFEFDIPPTDWWEPIRKADRLYTQSHFCADIFQNIPGLDRDIPVIPFAIPKGYKREGPSYRNHIKNTVTGQMVSEYEFVFGSVFQWVARKRPQLMWKAFMEEFPLKEYPNVAFINRMSIPKAINGSFRNWKSFVPKDPRIIVIDKYVPNMPSLYRSMDTYVSSTAGEGLGIPLMEAMACGLPTIAPKNGGNLDFMNEDNSFLVDVHDWSPVGNDPTNTLPMIKPWHRWRLPKISSLRKQMRAVYEGKYPERAREAEKVRDDFSIKNIAQNVKEFF